MWKSQNPRFPGKAISFAIFNAIATNTANCLPTHPSIWFPLPADHLLTLIQFNVYRGLMMNMELLAPILNISTRIGPQLESSPPLIPTAAPSTLTGVPLPPIPASIPLNLIPTPTQMKFSHPSWIDSFPLAALRDNLISELGNYDRDALCVDTLGGLSHNYCDANHQGVIVWADPWNVSAWEFSEGFLRKWKFLLKGCEELLDATNYWRRARHEPAICRSVLLDTE
jgi:hypothetical protein